MTIPLFAVPSPRRLTGVLLASAILGCADPETGADEADLHVTPTGSENWASLTLELPAGTCEPSGTCAHPLGAPVGALLGSGQPVPVGTAVRLKPGAYKLRVSGEVRSFVLAPGEKRVEQLAVANRTCTADALPDAPVTDFGPKYVPATPTCPIWAPAGPAGPKPTILLSEGNSCPAPGLTLGTLTPETTSQTCKDIHGKASFVSIDGAPCTMIPTTQARALCDRYVAGNVDWAYEYAGAARLAETDRAYLPGDHHVYAGGPTEFSLEAGTRSTIAVHLPLVEPVPAVWTTDVTFLDPRDLPTVHHAYVLSSCQEGNYRVPDEAQGSLHLRAVTSPECEFVFAAGGRNLPLDQNGANLVQLRRLDVDPVVVTREDGTTYSVPGMYELFFEGARVAGPYPTNTGLDVLPGAYTLVVRFTTIDGPQQQEIAIDAE